MDKKVYITLSAIVISIVLLIAFVVIFVPPIKISGERKTIILCSTNDFYGSEVEESFDFNGGTMDWIFDGTPNSEGGYTPDFQNKTLGSLYIKPQLEDFKISANFSYIWTDYYPIYESFLYNLTASVYLNISGTITAGNGVRLGIQWLNSSMGIIRTDWSDFNNYTLNKWFSMNIMSLCNNESENKMTGLKLIMTVEGAFSAGPADAIYLDDVILERWVTVNVTHPFDPTNGRKDLDGFPAQALQVYKVLKGHGYTDENIFLMLYHTNDPTIDIDAFDGILNDLIGVEVDVENNDVNATRFKQELNVSIAGSFASNISIYDQLIIFMTDHGSNKLLGDGNATFHFEADNSKINETEFYDLVKNINCQRMMINVDCCFSGNFLNEKKPIGSSWFDINNCLFVSSSADRLSWYWIDNKNADGWAGSWFFHIFWDQLDQNQTILNAFNFASGFIPAGQAQPLIVSQIPLMYDNMGINNIWGFNSEIKL